MTAYIGTYRSAELPWSISEEEEQRFRRILKRILLALLLFALIMPFLPLPKIARDEPVELPPRLAQLLLEKQMPPPPVAMPAEPELKKPEAKKPEAKKAEPKKVEPKKEQPRAEAARAKAEKSGLLAFKNELADLRDSLAPSKLDTPTQLAKGPTKGAGPGGPARASERALITAGAATGSGGINTAKLSRDTGGGGLGGRATTQVSSPVGDGGARQSRGGGGKAGRSIEEIKIVFDRNKGSIYTIYNRALRQDPTLQGKVVLKLTISPAGEVLNCQVVSSELKNTDLERKLVARIKQFNFGSKDVDTVVVTYPVDFLPS
jgi:protein TonB